MEVCRACQSRFQSIIDYSERGVLMKVCRVFQSQSRFYGIDDRLSITGSRTRSPTTKAAWQPEPESTAAA
jgi:hypothetical protein